MVSETRQLLDLQQADARLAEVVSHLEHLSAHRVQLEERIVQERTVVAARRDALRNLELESKARNLEVDELDAHLRAYQERLDKGIISFKEMEDLRTKIASERIRMGRLEDEALELMAQIETARSELALSQASAASREAQLQSQIDAISREIRETEEGRLAEARGARNTLASNTPPYLLTRYEALRATFPNPVAAIEHGTCGGCKIRVSANALERARAGREIVTCEHCSRILHLL